MSHLDAEFQRQSVSALRSLVTDQVSEEGNQFHHRTHISLSFRGSKFMELSANLASVIPSSKPVFWSLK